MIPTVRSPRRFLLAALLVSLTQCGVLGYMIQSRAAILQAGTEVLLKTTPVDPRDLLRGDYVILSYEISSIPTDRIRGERPKDGAKLPLFVRLRPDAAGFWQVDEASFATLAEMPGSVILRSRPVFVGEWMWTAGSELSVSYGIERYYVPEGEGRPIEDGRNENRVSVAARVSASGQAQIRALMLDGQPLYEEPLY
ncbi:GDYXXLXY domain-containing protein [Rhizobium sp. G187]|uniref:GDYXXLXY domain-containing protein n=1 Tax=Rhizobium sp. G187 TaxID=3451352 RepID=UPI003EE5870D